MVRMGFLTDAVQWWQESQLQILVLASLFIQCFLFAAARLRKRCIPGWFRFVIWLAYLGSDATAIYALATLFNRQKQKETADQARSCDDVPTRFPTGLLQPLWAPILLVHLGGQDSITAYNIEDNELWKRHVLTAVSQVTVAVYVFYKSFIPEVGDAFILQAAVLLFFVGIFKCMLKPWDLKKVSINSLVGSSAVQEKDGDATVRSLPQYVEAATLCFQRHQANHGGSDHPPSGSAPSANLAPPPHPSGGSHQGPEVWKPYDLLVDLTPPYSARLSSLEYFLLHQGDEHALVRSSLSAAFDRLYTKESLRLTGSGVVASLKLHGWVSIVRLLSAICLLRVITLYRNINIHYYDHTDIVITWALIYVTAVLEYVIPLLMTLKRSEGRWVDQVMQYNLVGYLARNRRHWLLRKLTTMLVCKDYLDQLWTMKPAGKSSARAITELVATHIRAGWRWQIGGVASYRRFNDNRGQWTLGQEGLLGALGWSVRRPFDESVLLWHLATDLCFHHMGVRHQAAGRSREISNYMAYLLFVNPEMLVPGARRSLFRAAYRELKQGIPPEDGRLPLGERELADRIVIGRVVADAEAEGSGSVVQDAWAIARELIRLQQEGASGEEGRVWRVVQGVWVEMLCFSAGRCRGYLHAKSLGRGGEYLSYVWLLLSYMGMETLAEKMQRSEERQEEGWTS